MRKNESGFTLIELMIVIAIIAIIAAIAIPNLLSARLNSNETAAIATLRNIVSAQSQFQSTARADGNNNGVGEYGGFKELSGGCNVRGSSQPLNPPVLSTAFRMVSSTGIVSRSGYLFRMFLPDAASADGAAEDDTGVFGAALDDDVAETTWCCYAWPANHGNTGNRSFFVSQGGDIIATDGMDATGTVNKVYEGTAAADAPPANAAFMGAGSTITGQVATGTLGRDGNFWKQAG